MSPRAGEERESFGRICERVCREQGWELTPSGVRVILSSGRTQVVDLDVFEDGGRERVRLSTRIGPRSESGSGRMEAALRVNSHLAHGALAIGDDFLIMTDTLALEDTGGEELESAIRYLGRTADEYERQIFQTDRH